MHCVHSKVILGRVLDGTGQPIDGLPPLTAHAQVAAQAQRLLRRYADLHTMIENGGLDALPSAEDRRAALCAPRLHRFLTQPFPGVEPWSGATG
jgi:F0F1-type ATP synthase beta subunit